MHEFVTETSSKAQVPKEEAKGFILGKSGARLMQISEDAGVVSVFAKLPDPPVEADEHADPEVMPDSTFSNNMFWKKMKIKK